MSREADDVENPAVAVRAGADILDDDGDGRRITCLRRRMIPILSGVTSSVCRPRLKFLASGAGLRVVTLPKPSSGAWRLSYRAVAIALRVNHLGGDDLFAPAYPARGNEGEKRAKQASLRLMIARKWGAAARRAR